MNENNMPGVHDVSPYVNQFLTDKTKEALKTVTPHLLHQYNQSVGGGTYVRNVAPVKFLGLSCAKEDISEAIQIICSKLNELADRGFVMASMRTMLVIPYVDIAPKPWGNACAVMSYVAISLEGDEYIKKYLAHLDTPEGGVPRLLSELEESDKDTSTYAISEE